MLYSKRLKWVVIFLFTGAVGFFTYKKLSDRTFHSDLSLGTVKRQDLVQRVTISGQLWPRKRLDVKPLFSGYIEKIFVRIGQRVKAGDPLVTFSPSLGKGETNFPVRAAFTGVVTQVLKNEGEYVTETGDQNLVLRVEDLSQIFILSTVPELDVSKLKVGQEATVRLSSQVGESFMGKIDEIAMSAKDKDRWSSSSTEFQVKVLLESHDPRLLPGMSALLDVVTRKMDNVLTLAHEFIEQRDGAFSVTTERGEIKTVELGLQTEEAAEIKSGLSEGERVRVIDFLNLPKVMD